MVSGRFLAEVESLKEDMKPVYSALPKASEVSSIVGANSLATVYNRASIAGKLCWYICQNLVSEAGNSNLLNC